MMKKIYTLLIALLVVSGAMGQSCLPDGITFETQAQIDSFQINYPGCTEIEGDVIIGEAFATSDITNLNGLNVLTSIGGALNIGYLDGENPFLASLAGLENITCLTSA